MPDASNAPDRRQGQIASQLRGMSGRGGAAPNPWPEMAAVMGP